MAIAPIEQFTRTPSPAGPACAALTDVVRDVSRHDCVLSGQDALQFIIDVEHASRIVDQLQIIAARLAEEHYAAAAEHESHSSSSTATSSTTVALSGTASAGAASFGTAPSDAASAGLSGAALSSVASAGFADATCVEPTSGGFRNCADFLRATLGISRTEARRRLGLAEMLLPRMSPTGAVLAPRREALGAATGACLISGRAATIICQALQRVESFATPQQFDSMEHHLTQQAAESDEDTLRVVARRWEATLDQDGQEPSEKVLHARQGVFLKGRRHGLHVLEIGATDEQYEHLATVMNSTANPRTSRAHRTGPDAAPDAAADEHGDPGGLGAAGIGRSRAATAGAELGPASGIGTGSGAGSLGDPPAPTRAQSLLDGLVTACKIALTTTGLPATGGHRPQVMVTIDYKDLVADIQRTNHCGCAGHVGDTPCAGQTDLTQHAGHPGHAGVAQQAGRPDHAGVAQQAGRPGHAGHGVFSEQVSARTIRTLACDADLIPLVLGSTGQILDIGRAQRLFPPHLRRALVARDKGCAFPDCSIPASWCEAHHMTPWSRGGRTSISNGVLLCTRHHHVIHQGTWTVEPRHGIPWFRAPGNPGRAGALRRNSYWQAGRIVHQELQDEPAGHTYPD
ncbi:HNH endonuclease [Arthrobacter agilis]|uniref:HNH endonuclease n=1 Tax=Arthrobacter agilis TaxID=37921 RepID=UPI00278383CB|nr:HNH endonuclease signature motif containing protein [Arthrobacter agilis]MDQ0733720.1 hypothetical protein [Arthrobacter agilis]